MHKKRKRATAKSDDEIAKYSWCGKILRTCIDFLVTL